MLQHGEKALEESAARGRTAGRPAMAVLIDVGQRLGRAAGAITDHIPNMGRIMASRCALMMDRAEANVLAAFDAAKQASLPTVDCYRAAVAAWRRLYPDQTRTYAAQRAVAVILAAKVSLRIPDE